VFMDNDIFSSSNWISECINTLESYPDIAIVQPLILPATPSSKAWGRGAVITPTFWDFISRSCLTEPFYALGSALIIKREVFRLVGGFSSYLEYLHEEVDLAWKSRLLGYRVKCDDKAIVKHIGRSSGSLKAQINSHRNRLLILLKNLQVRNLVVIIPLVVLRILSRKEQGNLIIKSLIRFLKLLPYAMRERRIVQEARKRSDVEIFKPFRKAILMELIKIKNRSRLAYIATLATYRISHFNRLIGS